MRENFTDCPNCALCGSDKNEIHMNVKDGMTLVECSDCGLLFTSPRIDEKEWISFLKSDEERNKVFTENRLRFGRALRKNIKKSHSGWRRDIRKNHVELFNEAKIYGKVQRLHDVGCGVGFLLYDAKRYGLEVSGNDLNRYACSVMQERYNLDVWNVEFPDVPLQHESLDFVTMTDFIEHTYHPDRDLRTANKLLRPGGLLYVKTFHIDCDAFEQQKENWDFLVWNHVYHFSPELLERIIRQAGFEIIYSRWTTHQTLIRILAKKLP